MSDLFIDDDELAKLTGRRTKSKQIEWLRSSGLPYRVSATGHPVVTRLAVEGRETRVDEKKRGWTPRAIGA